MMKNNMNNEGRLRRLQMAPNVSGFKSGGLDWSFASLKEFEVSSVRVEEKNSDATSQI